MKQLLAKLLIRSYSDILFLGMLLKNPDTDLPPPPAPLVLSKEDAGFAFSKGRKWPFWIPEWNPFVVMAGDMWCLALFLLMGDRKDLGRSRRNVKSCRWEFKKCSHREPSFLFLVLSETKTTSWMLGGLVLCSPELGGLKFWSCLACRGAGGRKQTREMISSFSSPSSPASESVCLEVS